MNIKSAWIVFVVTLLITLPTRIYQVLFLVDQDTGFYTDGIRTTAFVSVGLAVGVLLLIIMCFMDKSTKVRYSPIRSVPAAVIGALAGLGIILQYAVGIFTFDESQNLIPSIILSLIGICAGAIIILTAYNFAAGNNTFEERPLLALIPSVWGCASLVSLFITYVAVVNISENIYDTFTVIFLLLFLFAQAKMLSRIDDGKSGKMIYVFGLPAALLSLVTGIPGTVMVLGNISRTSSFPAGLYPVNVLLSLYVLVFLINYSHLKTDEPELANASLKETEAQINAAASGISEDADSEQPIGAPKQESCLEFLGKAYHSEERFCDCVQSPFLKG
nr:hypothetical protein [uncultured Caproiciproducens sp.]